MGCSPWGHKEFGTTEHLTLTTCKNLLNTTGNSTQYSVMTYVGKESLEEWIYVCSAVQPAKHKSTILQWFYFNPTF